MNIRPFFVLLLTLAALCAGTPAFAKEHKMLLLAAPPVQEIKLEHLQPLAANAGIQLNYRMLGENASPPDLQELKQYDFLMLDAAYGPSVMMLQQQFLPGLKNLALPWLWLRREGNQNHGLTEAQVKTLDAYYTNGGVTNYQGFFCQLKAQLEKTAANCNAAIVFSESGIYHPTAVDQVFTSLADYLAFRKTPANSKKPLVGILFHKAYVDSGMIDMLHATIDSLEAKGAIAVPMYVSAMGNGEITRLASIQNKPQLDVLINMQIMLNAEGRRAELEKLGIPVLQTMSYRHGDQQQWEKDNVGLTTQDIPFYLSQPEYAGLTDPMFIAASEANGNPVPITRQLESVTSKALAL